ncbi:hypothetical protein J8J27_34895, partial [Mycobacterium tuberculosis]|nr:hypothetical protein [Mycobacterium tuberculosis]
EPTWTGRPLADIIGANQPVTVLGARAGVMSIKLASGAAALAAVSHLDGALGAVAVTLPEDSVLAAWRGHVVSNVIVLI